MSLSSIFIHRPIATTLFACGIAFAGIIGFYLLPVAPLPRIDFPTINVQAALPGASPEIMATSVATPLERQLGLIAGITQLTSSSSQGNTRIIVQFDLSRNIDGAARDVQAAINASLSNLPIDLPSNPTYRKVNPADSPIMIISLTSDVYTIAQMYDAGSTILQQKLSQIEGVGQVVLGGGSLPAVRVELNPTALNSYGISLDTVRQSISSTNINRPKGQLNAGAKLSDITTNDQLFKAVQYEPLIIAYRNGAPVRLKDVGEVIDSVEDLRNAGLADGKPAVVLVVFKQPGANIIETVDRVRSLLPHLKASIPNAIDLTVAMDRTTTIRASLLDVELTLLIAIALVILVVYLFLRNARASLIPSVAVPLSLLGTFALMYLFDFSLNNLSLMALTIVTGFVVDDAVVVLENISRYIENGLKPLEAAIQGSKEVGFTVLSMSISLIAVFIPILLMGGIVGRLFREFALTLSFAILVSLLVSLTLTPMMCAYLLKNDHYTEKKNSFWHFFSVLKLKYEQSLSWALQHSFLMLILTIMTVVLTILLYTYIPKGFFPQQDTGRIISSIQVQQDMSFQAMQQKLSEFIKVIAEDPAIEHVTGFVGGTGGGASGGNTGSIYITLTPLAKRKLSADDVINRLRKKLANISGATLYMQAAQDLVIGGRSGNAQFQYTLTADNLQDLNLWAPKVLDKCTSISGITDLNTDQRDKGLQVYVEIDHDTASRFGLNMQSIDNILYDAFGQRQVSTLYTPMNQYHIVMEVAPRYWQHPQTLEQMYMISTNGNPIPFSSFAEFKPSFTLLTVSHQGQFPSTTLSFNLMPGFSLGDAVDKITESVSTMHLPQNIQGSFQGTAQAFQSSLASEPYLIIGALIVVYIVLGILYESLIHPITILSTLPSAGVGALLALLLTNTELSIIAVIGIILLIGIVKKNAIMMIDFALQEERVHNKSPKDAIFQAAILRFRPIMMTTMAALFSALPLALGTGVGSELRRPLGIAIIGGLLLSQVLTLYSTPVLYLSFENLKKWWLTKVKVSGNKHELEPQFN